MNLHRSIAKVDDRVSTEISGRGRVQGVGFRPTVWRYARELGLSGEVLNDASGVLIRVSGRDAAIAALIERLKREPPPLARIDAVDARPYFGDLPGEFVIGESLSGDSHTQITPNAMVCAACAEE